MNRPTSQYIGQQRAWQRPATVYRLFDSEGCLLYVGATLNPFARFAGHRTDRPWFFDVASVTFEHFEKRIDALEAEARAIRDEKPRYNGPGTSFSTLAIHRAWVEGMAAA